MDSDQKDKSVPLRGFANDHLTVNHRASCKIPDAQNVVLVAQSTLLCKGALFRPPRQEFSPFRHSSTEVSSLPVFGLAAVAVGAP